MANAVDAYIASFPSGVSEILQRLRETILAAAPDATERISYGIIGFFVGKDHLAYLGGWKTHIALYPIPPGSVAFEKQAAIYRDAKSTLRFPLAKPMPTTFIMQLVKARLRQLQSAAPPRTATKSRA
jgi:uncharacterized protein YdhG (YjbR/CyaY superfamily)